MLANSRGRAVCAPIVGIYAGPESACSSKHCFAESHIDREGRCAAEEVCGGGGAYRGCDCRGGGGGGAGAGDVFGLVAGFGAGGSRDDVDSTGRDFGSYRLANGADPDVAAAVG